MRIISFFMARQKTAERLLFPLLLVAAMLISVFDRGFWQREFWFDEVFTGLAVRLPFDDMLAALERDVHPPLYYLLLKLWGMVLGYGDIALRSFSVICFGLFLTAVYVLVCEGTRRVWPALGVTAFFAVNPFFVGFAQEARMYMLLTCLVTAATLFFLRALRASRHRFECNWQLFAVLLAAAMLTHYFTIFFAAGFAIYHLLSLRSTLHRQWFLVLKIWLGVTAVVTFFSLFWLSSLFTQFAEDRTLGWTRSPRIDDIADYAHIFLFGVEQGAMAYGSPVSFANLPEGLIGWLIILALLPLYFFKKHPADSHTKSFVISITVAATIALEFFLLMELLGRHYLHYRYLLFLLPFFLIPILLALFRLKNHVVIGVYATGYVLLLLLRGSDFSETHYRGLKEHIATLPAKNVLFDDPFDYSIAEFYRDSGQRYFVYTDEDLAGWTLIPAEAHIRSDQPHPPDAVIITRKADASYEGEQKIGESGDHTFYLVQPNGG